MYLMTSRPPAVVMSPLVDERPPAVSRPFIEKPFIEKPFIEKPFIEKPFIEKPFIDSSCPSRDRIVSLDWEQAAAQQAAAARIVRSADTVCMLTYFARLMPRHHPGRTRPSVVLIAQPFPN